MAGSQNKAGATVGADAAAAAPASRTVPGAGPLAAGKSKKKPSALGAGSAGLMAKVPASTSSPSAPNGNHGSMAKAAHAAALTSTAPPASKVNAGLKVQASDVAEEAERQAALAAVDVIEQKEGGSNGHLSRESDAPKSALQSIIAKRIKVLNKKLQRALQYEALDQTKVNDDQRRIVASRPGLEGSLAELNEIAKALEIVDNEAQRAAKAHAEHQIAAAVEKTRVDADKQMNVLLQLLHLHSLVTSSTQETFAPKPMPPVLDTATGQEMASVSKLYADLSSSNEVVPKDAKLSTIDKLARGSSDEIMEGVSFRRVLDLLEGLSIPVTQENGKAGTHIEPLQGKEEEPELATKQISFLQASELEDVQAASSVASAPAQAKEVEPEGGAVDSVPASAIAGSTSDKGQSGATGIVPGQVAALSEAKASQSDGTAKAAIEEPVQTTVVSAVEDAAPAQKVIDWSANDDDDFGDLEIQPTMANGAAKATEGKSAVAQVSASAPTEHLAKPVTSTKSPRSEKPAGGRPPRSRNPTNTQPMKAPAPVKSAPVVDEDGFTVASSKRSKFLQDKQQQQQQQQQSRDGRGSGGRNGRGGSGRGRGSGTRGGRGGAASAGMSHTSSAESPAKAA